MTVVSFKHDFIYLRTRKTGSTTTELFLQEFCLPPGKVVGNTNPFPVISKYGVVGRRNGHQTRAGIFVDRAKRFALNQRYPFKWYAHMPAWHIRRNVGREFWNRALKITTLRNPYTRLTSAFYFGRSQRDMSAVDNEIIVNEFREMVRNFRKLDDKWIVYVDDMFAADFVVHQETLDADLNALLKELNLSKTNEQPLKKHNSSANSDNRDLPLLSEMYDEECMEIVQSKVPWMFEYGGYSYDLPEDNRMPGRDNDKTLEGVELGRN